jgi:hypothetical protein
VLGFTYRLRFRKAAAGERGLEPLLSCLGTRYLVLPFRSKSDSLALRSHFMGFEHWCCLAGKQCLNMSSRVRASCCSTFFFFHSRRRCAVNPSPRPNDTRSRRRTAMQAH